MQIHSPGHQKEGRKVLGSESTWWSHTDVEVHEEPALLHTVDGGGDPLHGEDGARLLVLHLLHHPVCSPPLAKHISSSTELQFRVKQTKIKVDGGCETWSEEKLFFTPSSWWLEQYTVSDKGHENGDQFQEALRSPQEHGVDRRLGDQQGEEEVLRDPHGAERPPHGPTAADEDYTHQVSEYTK